MADIAKPSSKKNTNSTVTKTNVEKEEIKVVPKAVDDTQYVTVYNGFQGKLVYKSKHTNETFIWDKFGDEQDIELRELKNAKSSDKAFFINNWFMFKDEWIINYLGIRQFYKNALTIDRFDDIFTMNPKELKKALEEVPEGQKSSVVFRAKELIRDGKIDSLATISILEKCLNTELIER